MTKALEIEKWRIFKEVNVVSANQYGVEITIGAIIYDRKITNDYKLNEDTEPNKIKRLIDHPKQDLFTVDEIDELILNAIKDKFPKSFVKSYQVIFDSDEKSFNYLLKRPFEKAIIKISPDFADIDIYSLAGKSIPHFYKEINIYQDFTLDSIKSHVFRTNCNFERSEELIKNLKEIDFK